MEQGFDYSQLDELTARRLKDAGSEIDRHRIKIGESIYRIGSLLLPEDVYYQKVRAGMREIGMSEEDLQEALICCGLYLESELYGNKR